ncbi:MAG: SusC/RagA family TonB-linked outer membrane protein, partial [Tannerellaceae bacterium]
MEKKFNGSRYPVAALLSLSLLSVPMDMVATDVNITDHLAVGQSKSRIIEGIVKDDLGDVLPGASVVITGTTQGVATDVDGRFTLKINTDKSVVLSVSYLGMETQEIIVTPKVKELSIVLLPQHKALDEVVVTGFQTISRERSSGSAVILSKEKLTQIKAPNITSNLEGLVPGLTTYGGGMSIRGNSSFSINSQPLIVIDGMPVENITNAFSDNSSTGLGLVNPEDVDNITVLKDAAATSLYGVRAANGVIVITTKKGATQKPAVTVSANFYITQKNDLSYNKYASTADILDYEVEYMLNDPTYKENPLDYFSKINNPMGYGYLSQAKHLYYKMAMGDMSQADVDAQIAGMRNRDYRKEYLKHFTRNSFTQDYNVSISQGSDFAQTYFSARFQDSNGGRVDERNSKIALNLNNTFKFTKWLKLTTGMNMNIDQDRDKYMGGRRADDYADATYYMPYDQILDEQGNRVQLYPFNQLRSEEINANPNFQHMGFNMFDEMEAGSKNKNRDVYLKVLANAEIKLLQDLTMDVRFQYENINGKNEQFSSAQSYEMRYLINQFTSVESDPYYGDFITYNIPKGGRLQEANRIMQNYNFRAQLNYSKVFNEKHALTALGGFEMRENKISYSINERYGYDDQLLSTQLIDWDYLSKYGVVGLLSNNAMKLSPNVTMANAMHRYISAYLNAGYTYDGKYSATASVRMDQADLFGTDPKYRYRPLWSVGASWNANNEAFLKDLTWIDMLKLRTSYGITGNVDQNSTPFLLGFIYPSPDTGDMTTDVLTPPNKLLRWEKTSSFNFGIDFAAFNRLNASVDVYRKYSSDLLAPKRFDPSMGFPEGRVNNGAMKNRGIEMSASYDWIRTKDWRLSTQLTAAYNKNTIEKIDFEPTNALDLLKDPNGYYMTGSSRGTMYAYHYQGLNETGDPIILDENGEMVSYDAVRNINAIYSVGQVTPKWNGMLNLTVQYRDFEFFTRFVYYTGHSMRNDVLPLYQGVGLDNGDMH